VSTLSDADHELLRGGNYATLVTLNPDGSPQSSVVWIDADDERVLFNTAEGRVKDRIVRRDPRVAVTVVAAGDWYRWIAIAGEVVNRRTGTEADAHIDALSRRYDGHPWTPAPGQIRVRYAIRPDRVTRYPR
jgi:PPOX class probable F420-dependent enzyme